MSNSGTTSVEQQIRDRFGYLLLGRWDVGICFIACDLNLEHVYQVTKRGFDSLHPL